MKALSHVRIALALTVCWLLALLPGSGWSLAFARAGLLAERAALRSE